MPKFRKVSKKDFLSAVYNDSRLPIIVEGKDGEPIGHIEIVKAIRKDTGETTYLTKYVLREDLIPASFKPSREQIIQEGLKFKRQEQFKK